MLEYFGKKFAYLLEPVLVWVRAEMRNKPVRDWENRPNVKLGTGLDELYS